MAGERESQAYAEFLAQHPWHWFTTLTFSPTKRVLDYSGRVAVVDRFHPLRGMHLEAADKSWRFFIRSINEYLYGKRWMRHPTGGVVWVRGQEFHKSGRVHFHGCLSAADRDLNKSASRYHWHEWWFRHFGRNQIERPRDQNDVLGYVSKYVVKGGEVDLSHNFGRVEVPRLFTGFAEPAARPEYLAPVAPGIGRSEGSKA